MTDEPPATDSPTATDPQDAASTQIPLEDLIHLPDYYNPIVSPDGDRVAFYYDETGRVELYVQNLHTGERERISDGNVPRNARYPLAWSRDGERIFFHEDEGGNEQNNIHAMTLNGKREPLVTHDGQCILMDVGPDGRYLLFASTAGEQMNCYRYDRERDESEQLTEYDQPVRSAIYGPAGERIAYATNETDDLENRDVYIADADGSNPRNLDISDSGAETSVGDWAGTRLLINDNSADLGRVGVYDVESDEATWYGPGDYEEYAVRFTPDGDVLAMRTRECAILPVRYESPDDGVEFDLPEGVAAPVGTGTSRVVTDDGRVVTSFGTADGCRQLVAYDPASGDHEPIIEAEYGEFDPDEFADAEYVTYESHDRMEIDGLLYDSGKRPSPALVMVHGGPHAQTLRRFNPFVQYLVSRGYSILSPNYRGSTGKGREFKNTIHGDWGGDEQGDIAEAGRWLEGLDWTDDDRVGVFGGSYGGYSTYCQLTMHPERWATGIAIVGMTDLKQLYEESMPHFKTTLEQQLGDPEENAEFYRERSPITHVEDMERPICIVHGVNDPRCPISQARLFRDALGEMGWQEGEDGDYEYHELGEEGHGSTDTEQRIRQYQILADYIERRL
jgi:dipeptidyl aminopeptidase/acylaminoacyl peptidase